MRSSSSPPPRWPDRTSGTKPWRESKRVSLPAALGNVEGEAAVASVRRGPACGRLVLELHRLVRPVLGGTALLDDDVAVRVGVAGLERPAGRVAGAVPLGLALVVAAGVALGADA